MLGRTHVAVGSATALGLCAVDPPTFLPGLAFVVTAAATSKLPDQLELGVLRHRGPTHWLLSGILVAFVIGLIAEIVTWTQPISPQIMFGALVGYWMHLVADACTVSGVPLLGPFSRNDHRLLPNGLRAVTGGPRDTFTRLIATAATIGLTALLVLPLPSDGILVSDSCKQGPAKVRLSKTKHRNIIAHIRESWREGYPRKPRINREGADRRRDKLLAWYERRHPQPVGDNKDLDEAPAAVLRRKAFEASVKPVPESENRSAGAILRNSIRGVCNGERVVYVFAA